MGQRTGAHTQPLEETQLCECLSGMLNLSIVNNLNYTNINMWIENIWLVLHIAPARLIKAKIMRYAMFI